MSFHFSSIVTFTCSRPRARLKRARGPHHMVTVLLVLFAIASTVSAEDGRPTGSDPLKGLRGAENPVQ